MPKKSTQEESGAWLTLSDMMTVLMVIFLIISITVSIRLEKFQGVLGNIANEEELLCKLLAKNLDEHFSEEDISIECTPIRIIFTHPDYKFAKNSSDLSPSFKSALEIFFPVYMNTLEKSDLKKYIDEVRIEGHTDSDGGYIYNMELSQDRSRNVLNFAISLPQLHKSEEYQFWVQSMLTANGLSFSRRVDREGKIMRYPYDGQGEEDKAQSRRVEVKLRTEYKETLTDLENGLL